MLLVDHDVQILKQADWLIEMGPEAGAKGGTVIAEGPVADIEKNPASVIGKYLSELPEGAKNQYAMVGFRVGNTLSENGTVARGICTKNDKGHLTDVVERTEIVRCAEDGSNAGAATEPIRYKDENGSLLQGVPE